MKKGLALAIIILASVAPMVSAGTVTRSFSDDPVDASADTTVSLDVAPSGGEEFYAIDEEVPSEFTVKSFWNAIPSQYALAANCGDLDSTVSGVTCEINACDIYNNQWCDNFAWTGTGYDTHCGPIDSDYPGVTCVDDACDIYSNMWCDGGTWTATGYASACGIFDSANCVMSNGICTTTCSAGACDLENQQFCFAVTDGGKTSEAGHVKWVVTSGATQTTYDYDARAPSSAQTVTWNGGDYQFNGSSTSSSIGGDTSIVVQAGCVPQTEVCDGVDNSCEGTIDEGCDDDSDDYCDGSMTVVGTPPVCPNGGGDCADTNSNVNPGATEICNNLNDDCSGTTDDGCDDDGDDYCDGSMTVVGTPTVCPNGGGDCDDDPAQCGYGCNPGAQEACPYTSVNEDCDSYSNEFRGDLDCSCSVLIGDFTIMGGAFETSPPSDARADVNNDNTVDIFDLVVIGSNFGVDYSASPYFESCP